MQKLNIEKQKKLITYLQEYLTERRKEKLQKVLAYRTRHFAVVLEDITQEHNAGALMRSCDCFGIQDFYVLEQNNKLKVSKSISKGAVKWIDRHPYYGQKEHIKICIKDLRQKGYQIVATTPNQASTMLSDFDIRPKSAFFFGTEQTGLSEEMLKEADVFLQIPTVGFSESLNVSVSAAIILSALTQRLYRSNVNWQLSETEYLDKKIEWIQKSIPNGEEITQNIIKTKLL